MTDEPWDRYQPGQAERQGIADLNRLLDGMGDVLFSARVLMTRWPSQKASAQTTRTTLTWKCSWMQGSSG